MPVSPRVLIFHPAPAPYRIDLFNELARGYRLRVVFQSGSLPNHSLDAAALRSPLIVEHAVLERGLIAGGYALRYGYSKEIRRFRPDVVITSEFGTASLVATLRAGASHRKFIHVIWTDDNPESVEFDSPTRRVLRRLLLPRAAGLVTVSDETTSYYRNRFRFHRPVACVPILQEDARFREALASSTADAVTLAQTHGLEGKRILLFVGRLAPEKGLTRLLDAFAGVAGGFADAGLVLIGDGPCRSQLEKQVRALGIADRVLFAGQAQRSALLAWYRIGGALVLPSLLERFGAVVNEALLAGLFVACSRFAGARVLLRPPHNGLIIDPTDAARLRDAVAECLANVDVLSGKSIRELRPSRMPIEFGQSVRGFRDLIDELSGSCPGVA